MASKKKVRQGQTGDRWFVSGSDDYEIMFTVLNDADLFASAAATRAALKNCERYMTEKGVSHEYSVMIDARAALPAPSAETPG